MKKQSAPSVEAFSSLSKVDAIRMELKQIVILKQNARHGCELALYENKREYLLDQLKDLKADIETLDIEEWEDISE